MGFDIVNIANKFLRVKQHSVEGFAVNNETIDVRGLNSCSFFLSATSITQTKVYIEGGVPWSGVRKWIPLTLYDEHNNYSKMHNIFNVRHYDFILRADISEYSEIRVRQELISGANANIYFNAIVNSINLATFKNRVIYSVSDTFLAGKAYSWVADFSRSTTTIENIFPIKVNGYRKLSLLFENNMAEDIIIEYISLHSSSSLDIRTKIEDVPINVIVPQGGKTYISSDEYSKLESLFDGISVYMNNPKLAQGDFKLTVIGGN